MIGSQLLRYQQDQEYIVLDVETESLNCVYARPFQVSFSVFTLNGQKEFHNYFIKWNDLSMSYDAARITNFNREEYQSLAKDPLEILKIIESYIYNEKYKLLGHNYLGFDCMIINSWRRALGLRPTYDYLRQPFKVYDTLALSRAYKKQIKLDISSSSNFLAHQFRLLDFYQKGFKTSLSVMSKELGIQTDTSRLHTANYDIEINAEVFRQLIWKLEI